MIYDEMEEGEENIYSDEICDEKLENDEIEGREAGFMSGYNKS